MIEESDFARDDPCRSIGQLNLSELAGAVCGRRLPSSGLLSMFTNIETEGLGTFSICVRYFPGVGQLERFIPPSNLREDNLPVVAREMLLTERLSLPDYAHSVWEAELGLDGFGEIGFKKIGFEIYRAASASLKGDDQIGFFGYLPGTTGDDPTPDRDHVRFASLRISEDAGIAHLAIHKDDLKSLDLRSLKYVWLDWDS